MLQPAENEPGRYKMTGKRYQAFLRLFAAVSALNEIEPELWELLGLVKMGRCDFCNAAKKLDRISQDLLESVPTKKLLAMRRELKAVRVYLRIGPDASPARCEQVVYVPEDALIELLNQIVQMHCWCCEKRGKEVKKCQWLQLMDAVLPYSPDPDLDPEDGSCQIAGRTSILEDDDNGN